MFRNLQVDTQTTKVSFASVQRPEAESVEPVWYMERKTNLVLKNPILPKLQKALTEYGLQVFFQGILPSLEVQWVW